MRGTGSPRTALGQVWEPGQDPLEGKAGIPERATEGRAGGGDCLPSPPTAVLTHRPSIQRGLNLSLPGT